jgi:hypothetical protein
MADEIPPPTIAIVRNPLQPARRELHEAEEGEWLIDWLQAHYPKGFGAGITLARNGREIEIADLDLRLEAGDVVTLLVHPGAHIALGTLIAEAIIGAIIGAATTLLFNLIFGKPKGPSSGNVPPPDPIYSISGAQNAARLGEPIPALYGRMLTTPDYASQPYVYFDSNDQYLAQILCIGHGRFVLNDIRVGTTPVSALESNAVQYWLIDPATHAQAIGRIEALTGIMENVVSSPEVADQELSGAPTDTGPATVLTDNGTKFVADRNIHITHVPPPGLLSVKVSGSGNNDRIYTIAGYETVGGVVKSLIVVERSISNETPSGTITFSYYNQEGSTYDSGPFVTSKPGADGDRIMCDFVFPQGLFEVDDKTGRLLELGVSLTIQFQLVAADGSPIGGWSDHPVFISRASNTPVRVTESIDVPPGRYRVQVHRYSPAPANGSQSNSMVWTGLKFRLLNVARPVYGETTLLAVRIRATNGIAANASSRITADVTRMLPALGDAAGALRPSRDPAEAFADIYCNATYGARRPLAELDLAELQRLQAHWAGEARFDGGFAQKSTIWEALTIALQTAAAAPLPLGQLMSAAQDGVKALRTQLFSDANIRKGSLSIGYSFDKPGDSDGIRVEYRDPATWNQAYQQWPAEALDPDAITLFGCADPGQALSFAKLLWQKRIGQRKSAQFETELEGLIPRLGDRVAIAVQLPRWSKAGLVARAEGLTLTLDAAPEWPEDWAAGGWVIVLRNEYGEPSAPIAISPGFEPNEIVLAALPPFAIFGNGTQEPTHYAIGTAAEQVADFSVANIEHRGGAAVAIEALAYNPAVYAGTLPWLERPI